jgi:hypothetical protein
MHFKMAPVSPVPTQPSTPVFRAQKRLSKWETPRFPALNLAARTLGWLVKKKIA